MGKEGATTAESPLGLAYISYIMFGCAGKNEQRLWLLSGAEEGANFALNTLL